MRCLTARYQHDRHRQENQQQGHDVSQPHDLVEHPIAPDQPHHGHQHDGQAARHRRQLARHTKPRHIAERLKISRNLVYKCLDRLKANLKAFLQMTPEQQESLLAGNMPRLIRDRKTEDSERIEAVKAYI